MSETDFIDFPLSCSPLFSFLSLYILDSFPRQGRDTRREESRQQFVQLWTQTQSDPSFLEQRQLNMTCGTVTCGSGHGFRFHAMLKGVLWWTGHLGYWLLLSCVCWVTSFARDPTVHSSMTLLLVRSPGFGNRRSKIFNAVVFKISHKWNRRGRGQTIQTSPKPRAWQQRCPHTFGRFVCFTPWWHLAVTSRLPSVCVCVCVCVLQVEVIEGCLQCPESGREFPISRGIPNMLLSEDEA